METILIGNKNSNFWTLGHGAIELYHKKQGVFHKPKLEKKVFVQHVQTLSFYWESATMTMSPDPALIVFIKLTTPFEEITFEANTGTSRKPLQMALTALKESGIVFDDEHHLYDAIMDDHVILWNYINKIRKGSKILTSYK